MGAGDPQTARGHDAAARACRGRRWRNTKGSAIGWKRKSIAKRPRIPNPGSVVLHRLNRTEYANAIRDLLDLQIDVTTLLPPDDSARGFDNVAGSLTISPTLLEAYTTAATRIARTAVGFWKSPTEAAYIAPGDTSQNQHIEGLPFGTRGGMAVRHSFPSDGEYKFSVQNFGLGKFIPGEKLEFLIDNETGRNSRLRGRRIDSGECRGSTTVPSTSPSR